MEKLNCGDIRKYINILYCFTVFTCFISFPIDACEYCFFGAAQISEDEFDDEYDADDMEFEYFVEYGEIDYGALEEYEAMYRDFEIEVDEAEEFQYGIEYQALEDGTVQMSCFVGKWCNNLKNWFKKATYKMVKSLVDTKKYKDPEQCAYKAAKFKRRLDRYFKTPSMRKVVDKFFSKTNGYPQLAKLTDRIQFYYKNKHAKPLKDFSRIDHRMAYEMTRPEYNGELDHIPVRVLVGGVAIFSGILICALPEPVITKGIGGGLISGGMLLILETTAVEYGSQQE